MDLQKFFSIKRNINFIYDIEELKKKCKGLEEILILFFLNNILIGTYLENKTTITLTYDLSKYNIDEILELFLIYINNILSNNKNLEESKINNIIIFINLYIETKGLEKINEFKTLKKLYESKGKK